MNRSRTIPGVAALALFFAWSIQIGDQADAAIEKTLDGSEQDPFTQETYETLVFIFVGVDCPISNRYSPRVNRIFEAFEDESVGFWSVYTDDYATLEQIREHRRDYRYQLPALIDFDHSLVKRCEATVTPEAVVFVRSPTGDFRPVYRGRIDNQYVDFGKWRVKATVHDLQNVLERIQEGRSSELELSVTEAVGCYISH